MLIAKKKSERKRELGWTDYKTYRVNNELVEIALETTSKKNKYKKNKTSDPYSKFYLLKEDVEKAIKNKD